MMKLELVRDWMSRDVVTVGPDTLLPEANRLMMEKHVRRLPVVGNGRLLGILTYGDIRGAGPSSVSDLDVAEVSYLMGQIKVEQVMSQKLVTIDQDATIGEAAELMLQYAIGGLPVLGPDGALIGIITESDIFRLVVHGWRRTQDDSSTPYTHYG
ncbi:MAG: CBS domain-containing protein [Ardenticatenaceae bacterium]|nr:CBS domain-containing protein [Anaerolineales bacterium]MCB8923410.1 CBS domain-containing protein [Ardenticatenaceae bacterium]